MTYLPWDNPVFQKMIFYLLRGLGGGGEGRLLSINQIIRSGQERGFFYIPKIIYKLDGKLACVCACVTIRPTEEFQNCGHPVT